jgi:pectinesterase
MRVYFILVFLLLAGLLQAQRKIIVDPKGKGDARTIQGAINMVTDKTEMPVVIFIRKGVYDEKLYIEKPFITLEGEDRTQTVITASIARDEWRCAINDDWGVATINVGASDLTLKNLTVVNRYGFEQTTERIIDCPADSSGRKKVARNGHQMAVRVTNLATRMKAINCHFKSFGGDTMSPWEVNNGMWYFKDCVMEGAVDLYCPRGWAWAENCTFIAHSGTAIIWHDGSSSPDARSVLKNCRFQGYDRFLLGRYHREAQFYLVDCRFAANMRDAAIYQVPVNQLKWGHRVYYADCFKEDGKDFSWYKNNLPNGLVKSMITPQWVFGTRWDPLKN